MAETFELIRAAVPTRPEKKKIARMLEYNGESTIYKWCEDPDGSGRLNPIDRLDAILDHARVHHPDAALAIEQHIAAGNRKALAGRVANLRAEQLLAAVQPTSEKEALDAVRAFSHAVLEALQTGEADLDELLREVEEAERAMRHAGIMIRAAIENERAPAR